MSELNGAYTAGGQEETGSDDRCDRRTGSTLSICGNRFLYRRLGGLEVGDDQLRALEDAIARNPTRAPVVPGAGGARKIRLPDVLSGKGKSGDYRVLYAFLPLHGTVLLMAAWPKSEREDLEPEDYKAIGKIISRLQSRLDQGRNL
jgi:mRNA-degrading endonuclease RelE of RelBE toxin-antitoxin system